MPLFRCLSPTLNKGDFTFLCERATIFPYIYIYVKPTVVRLRVSTYTKRTKMVDASSTFFNKKKSNNTISMHVDSSRSQQAGPQAGRRLTEPHKRQLAMDRAGRRQHCASETAEEREARLYHVGELVERSVLHWRLPNSKRHASLDVVDDAKQTCEK